ncbi:hypothetical protein Ga0123462_1380 [Mariprofundus ferrinatatus]|uniref:Uncharacterized protein n=2 Tax=Mariprofundus ferrinatatus TaxID=1921087 RepID=A0A2K8L4S9_9PROT|nr:hypothetical protein Ga0123462_1380 [Mariprofundus ferrinatatus]
MLKVAFWLTVIGFSVWTGAQVFHAHYINWKIEDVFHGVVKNMRDASGVEIREQLPKLYKINYLAPSDLPEEFRDNLLIRREGELLEISSVYSVVIWPFGPVQQLDESGEYDPDQLEGMDIVRDKSRIDIKFEPYAFSE